MALKPRTFRRIILLGSLASVILILTLGYFVIRPWQSQRKLDSMRVDGMAAAQEGDHETASTLLNRYLSRTDDPDPEVVLTFARSRLKYQASDYGHVRLAIRYYRAYLVDVPDDVEVAKELLPLFNFAGMSLEAKQLAESLRTKYNDTSIEVLREEIAARRKIDEDDPEIEPLFIANTSHEGARFQDIYHYVIWLAKHNRNDEARAFVETRLQNQPDDVDAGLAAFWVRITGQNGLNEEFIESYVSELAAVIGLDPQTNEWINEPDFMTPEIVAFVDRLFNGFARPDLSLTVRLRSAESNKDAGSMMWAARRLYWLNDFERLAQLDVQDADGQAIPDVLAYQILARRKAESIRNSGSEAENGTSSESSDDQTQKMMEQLEAIVLDFRGKAWVKFFEGLDLFEDDQSVEARAKIKEAITIYPSDPIYYLMLGDIYAKHGRITQAKDEWVQAQDMVMQMIGNVRWIEPTLRIINAYTKAGRLIEAVEYVDRLVIELAPQNPVSTMIWLQSYASLARTNDLDRSMIENILIRFESAQGVLTDGQQAFIAPQIAGLYASVGRNDEAKAVLASAVASSPPESILLDILEIDQRYELGIAQDAGIDPSKLAASTPRSALRYALNLLSQTENIEDGLAIFEQGMNGASGDQAYKWANMRVRYLDTAGDPRAVQGWADLRAAHPDDISLLYQIVESDSAKGNLDLVNEIIDEIVAKTSTEGQAIPSRLRLAQASAIVQESPNRKARDRAIEIVRAVVTSEPKSVNARNMLGKLLALKPSPTLDPSESFEPDFDGAIDQFITISRQLKGRAAQNYLLGAIDLSFEKNDVDLTRQYLLEFNTKFADDYETLPSVARRLENINDLDSAARIYQRIYQNATTAHATINAALSLVNVYNAQNERALVLELLEDLREEPTLDADQLVDLASLHTKNGYQAEGDDLAKSGERFGLDAVESKMVYARYARAFVSGDEYESALKEVVELDPTNEEAWTLLVRRVVREQRFDEAQGLVAKAIAQLPENKDLQALSILARGQLESASELLDSGVVSSNPFIVEAVKRVDAFMDAKKNNVSAQQRVTMLASMLEDFADFLPVQRFAIGELNAINVDPNIVAQFADKAGRAAPNDSLIMRIAGQAYLRAANPGEAMRIARLWRANSIGTPLEPDLILAQALIQLDDFESATKAIEPYVRGAIENPTTPSNAQLIHAYTHARLMLGEDPQVAADRIESLLSNEDRSARQIWLNLATGSVPSIEDSARWMESATQGALPEEFIDLANAWLVIIDRFNAQDSAYAQMGIDLIKPVIESEPENLGALNTWGRLTALLARATTDRDKQAELYNEAAAIMSRADTIDSTNPSFLAQSAIFSTQGMDDAAAESKYRTLLKRGVPDGRFAATIQNNLAMLIERQSKGAESLVDALKLSTQATDAVGIASFWGTRGWIELALGKLDEAELSFQKAIDQSPETLEGWVGIAIVQYQSGSERAQDAAQSFERVMELVGSGTLSDELMSRLESKGDERWTSVLVP